MCVHVNCLIAVSEAGVWIHVDYMCVHVDSDTCA